MTQDLAEDDTGLGRQLEEMSGREATDLSQGIKVMAFESAENRWEGAKW